MIVGTESSAYCVQSDPVARPFIAKTRTPPARAFASSVWRPADAIRPGSRDLQDAWASLECTVKRDHLIAHNFGVLHAELREHSGDPFLHTGHTCARNPGGSGFDIPHLRLGE